MDRLHLTHAKLLFLISELHNEGRLNDVQKLSLKYAVFKDETTLLDLYNSNPDDIDNLQDKLVLLASSVVKEGDENSS